MNIKKYARKALTMASEVALNRLFHFASVKQNKILFLSDVRDSLDGNLSFVRNALPDTYEVHTSLKADRKDRLPLAAWMRRSYDLATSRAIFLDDFADATAFLHVRKGQDLIQLWHGSGAYKKFAYGRAMETGDLKHVHPGYKRYTKAIVSSASIQDIYAKAFGIEESKVYATGVPRTDAFFDQAYMEEKKRSLYEKYPDLQGKKLILLAPTYRGERVEDADYDFDRIDLPMLYEKLKDDYALIIKWHPALYQRLSRQGKMPYDLEKYQGFLYDLSSYREVNDLLFAADYLITDYSSVIFDYALLDKPIIYFTYDLKDYEDGRGLYFPFEDYVYGAVAQNSTELLEAILQGSMMEEKRERFIERFVQANDGGASQRVIELLEREK